MRRSIATVSLSGTLPEKLDAIAAARFDGVEIFEPDLTGYHGRPRDVRAMAADLGLTIELFQPFRNAEAVDEARFRRTLDRLERKFDLMGDLGVSLMLVCSNVEADAIDDDGLAADQLHRMAERAAARSIRLGYEALAWGTRVNTFDHAWKIVEQAAHPHLGLILDSFHTLALPHDWSGVAGVPGDRIFFVQLADAPRLDMATLMLSRHHRCLPGQGEFDVGAFTEAALRAGYTGPLSLEIFSDSMRSAPARQTAKDAMRSLLHVEEQVRRVGTARVAEGKTTPPRRVELFDPPPPARLDGIAFVEFAVNHEAQAKLARMLQQIGFRRMGRHRSKDVDLYGQGDIRFVLNAEPQSTAHSYYLLHGPSVCAIAYDVDDPRRALGRAEAFGCHRAEGRVGPNEAPLAGIRATGGELVYFTTRSPGGRTGFEADFVLDPAPDGPAPAGELSRIDHIAQVLPEGALDSAVLFHRTVLDLAPEPVFILPDPFGLVRSRAISDARRRVRFPLNIANGRNTAAARSVSTYLGAGVHHIALETSDIFAAAERLAAAGTAILPIPANYYDDLAARLPMDEDLLSEMARLNILYDRDGAGEFFQLYTQPFEGRFFFELVERRGGYDQYGAVNAAIRMAAATQLAAGDTLVG
ncbi:4-hydroxyphenylpyruvate dioxygenase [Azospirillum fermentarium]|uniref:bifunctional sugar phosphate isomerase/epimerase/4-hydroxyphenylpyruvate dioxygenase family protein n=1 Tax=Azospirillum fermentarium TaxID=1233114 RepID=UPI002225D8AF|nr:sugar phosphate isomerase/epimerase and 4-hydroxyphenylpyruvate domain-containing protein [Azospirillum fermentarium]MCW2249467.1 4-hydroxyphenylpyruvate dioxygenase [Azospirillum fermentarium]